MPEICIQAPAGECIHIDEAKNDRRVDFNADDAKIKSLIAVARQAVESKTRQQLLHARYKLILDRFPGGGFAALQNAVNIPAYAIQLPRSPVVRVVSVEYIDMADQMQTMPPADYVVNAALMPAVITPAFGRVWPIPLPQIASVFVTYEAGYASPITTGGALAANQFKVSGPVAWQVGDRVNFYNSGGALPAPLADESVYLIASAAGGVYTITDEDGSPVTLTTGGTGRSFIGVVPDGIRSWMLLRVGSLYESREEVAMMTRGKLEILPYVDSLLDPFIASVY
jgi:uncharacterized phiE125 gp8 family phage protein